MSRLAERSFSDLARLAADTFSLSLGDVTAAARLVTSALRRGRKLLLCGNGGSAADCQHLAAELVGRFRLARRALPAVALTTDTSALTAVGNDLGFEQVFSRQVQALGQRGDVLLCLSTSGTSPNIIEAARVARKLGLKVVSLVGADSRRLAPLSDLAIRVPSRDTPRIQEIHALIGHVICDITEAALYR
ncbi:D-sedoheptulose 7-phosphate isomerase [candidate division WOR-3 bacterium]|nr:D-sedoheptulose 7-phosphate isomerase [candidate division WOR-3 bacterium]